MDGTYELAVTGEPLRLIGVVADITERKTLEQEAKEHSERLVTLQEEERQRIAQELHDSTAQHLVAANLNLMNLRSKVAVTGDAARLCDEVEASMQEALRELRTFSYLMHPPALHADGLRSTVRQYLDGYAKRSGLGVKLRSNPMTDKLPFEMQRSLLRVTQEAVGNVQRHASASHVSVDLRWINGRLHLIVVDDGHGVKVVSEQADSPDGNLGISGIKARAHQFGGDFKMRSGPCGTTIHVATPVDHSMR
jgi:signal transduction histidine kinase